MRLEVVEEEVTGGRVLIRVGANWVSSGRVVVLQGRLRGREREKGGNV